MKFKHTSLEEATEKVNQLQGILDPMWNLFFGETKPSEEAISALPKGAYDKYVQLSALRAAAQKLVTTLIYRILYLSLPGNPNEDTDKEEYTRSWNKELRKELGMSVSQFRRFSQYSIDILLPLADDAVKIARESWEQYNAFLAAADATPQEID